jgi:hypothetical protein
MVENYKNFSSGVKILFAENKKSQEKKVVTLKNAFNALNNTTPANS